MSWGASWTGAADLTYTPTAGIGEAVVMCVRVRGMPCGAEENLPAT